MIDPEMDLVRDKRMLRLTDMEHNLAAIVAITRRDWLTQQQASTVPDKTLVDRFGCEYLLSGCP